MSGKTTGLSLVGTGTLLGDLDQDVQALAARDPQKIKALRAFVSRLLDTSIATPDVSNLPCPSGMKIFSRLSKAEAFMPESISTRCFDEVKTGKSFTGVEILSRLKTQSEEADVPLGAEHAFFLIKNYWRVYPLLERRALAFFGTIYTRLSQIGENPIPSEQFVFVLELDDEDNVVFRLKALSETFDKFYPLAVLTF